MSRELTPVEAAAKAAYEAQPWRFSPPHPDTCDGMRVAITAALDNAQDEMTNVLSKAWSGATVGDMVQEIRAVLLAGGDS